MRQQTREPSLFLVHCKTANRWIAQDLARNQRLGARDDIIDSGQDRDFESLAAGIGTSGVASRRIAARRLASMTR